MRIPRQLVPLILAAAVVGCTSPEATRLRGGGPGADVGNTGPAIELHAGSSPYFETQCLGLPGECAEQEEASGQQQVSR